MLIYLFHIILFNALIFFNVQLNLTLKDIEYWKPESSWKDIHLLTTEWFQIYLILVINFEIKLNHLEIIIINKVFYDDDYKWFWILEQMIFEFLMIHHGMNCNDYVIDIKFDFNLIPLWYQVNIQVNFKHYNNIA